MKILVLVFRSPFSKLGNIKKLYKLLLLLYKFKYIENLHILIV